MSLTFEFRNLQSDNIWCYPWRKMIPHHKVAPSGESNHYARTLFAQCWFIHIDIVEPAIATEFSTV